MNMDHSISDTKESCETITWKWGSIKPFLSKYISYGSWTSLVRLGHVTLSDQIVVSGANFLTNIILARYLTSTEYGTYTVAFSVLVFINSIRLALISGPMVVLGASLNATQFRRYFNSLAVIQLVFAVSVSLLLVLVLSIGKLLVPDALIFSVLLPVAVITIAVQFQEYFRQTFFARLVPIRSLSIDLVRCGSQLIALAVLYRIGILSARMTFWAIGIASAISAAEGFRRFPVLIDGISEWKKHLLENWSLGKWMLTYTLIRYALGQIYIIATALALGVANTARFQAGMVIVGPIMMMSRGFMNILTPFFSKRFSQRGYASFWITFIRIAILWVLLFGCICFVPALLASKILTILYQQKYSGEAHLVRILALGCLLSTLSQYTEVGVRAIKRPQLSVKAGLIALVFTAIMMWPLLSKLGIIGAGIGWATSSGLVLGVHGILLLYESRKLVEHAASL